MITTGYGYGYIQFVIPSRIQLQEGGMALGLRWEFKVEQPWSRDPVSGPGTMAPDPGFKVKV